MLKRTDDDMSLFNGTHQSSESDDTELMMSMCVVVMML